MGYDADRIEKAEKKRLRKNEKRKAWSVLGERGPAQLAHAAEQLWSRWEFWCLLNKMYYWSNYNYTWSPEEGVTDGQ